MNQEAKASSQSQGSTAIDTQLSVTSTSFHLQAPFPLSLSVSEGITRTMPLAVPRPSPSSDEEAELWLPDPRSDDFVSEWNALLLKIIEDDDEQYTISVLQSNCPKEALYPISPNRFPLHLAVDRDSPRPDLVRWLSDTAPDTVKLREQALSPLDLLSSHILAKEELQRYAPLDDSDTTANWSCVQILASTIGYPGHSSAEIPTLTACLQAQDYVPFSLLERAIRRSQSDALVPDDFGNLPLHICLAWRPEEEELDIDLVRQVMNLAPEATQHANQAGCLPLDLAMVASRRRYLAADRLERQRQGRLWKDLIDAYPKGLGLRGRLPPRFYPYLSSEIFSRASPDVFYSLLSYGN